ncbi:MAG: cytochrome c [Caldilineaceae bacterium]
MTQNKNLPLQRGLKLLLMASVLIGLTLLVGCQPLIRPISVTDVPPKPPKTNLADQPAVAAPIISGTTATTGNLLSVSVNAPISTPLSVAGTVALSATTSITTAAVAGDAQDLAALVAVGQEVYLKQYCGICHQLDALGTTGTFGPPHNGIAQRADERIHDPNYHGHAQTAAEYLMESLTDPTIYIVPDYVLTSHPMPNYSYLSEADRQALVAMLMQER